jgi:hypothetical protein
MGASLRGAYTWPGAFGTSWQVSPQDRTILIYLIQDSMSLEPEALTHPPTPQGIAARSVLPKFLNLAHEALAG